MLSLVPKMNKHEEPSYYGFHEKVANWINNIREIQHISLLQTHQNSLPNKWPIRQTRSRDESEMPRLCGPIQR